MARLILLTLLLVALAFSIHAQDQPPAAEKGAAVRSQAGRDIEKLFPQRCLGGSDPHDIKPNGAKFSECRIEQEGCEKMKGFVSVPEELEPGRKYALMFIFHGNGDRGEGRTKGMSQITTKRDPVFVVGVQYQELQADGSGKMGMPTLAEPKTIIQGCKWLLEKVIKDHPIDTSRVFVGGFSWGGAWATGWCLAEWRDNPDKFPFRACFLYSAGGQGTKETLPPIPYISTVGENETAAKGNYEVLPTVRNFSNVILSWGLPALHHEIPGMGHQVNHRCLQITRDAINELGGPGALAYPAKDNKAESPEPLPFEASEDFYVKEIQALCSQDKWSEALARIEEIDKDRKIKSKEKKAVISFRKTMEDFARKDLARLEKIIAQNVKDEILPGEYVLRRFKALLAAYAGAGWMKGKSFAETIAKIDDSFPPVARERQREQQMRDALALEAQDGKRADAKALYEKLAARKNEDGGASIWPRAAAYRLQWWVDG